MANVWVQEFVAVNDPYEYRILINTETARKKGFTDGDQVVVEAWHGGRTEGTLKLTELMFPEALGFPSNHGFKSRQRNPITRPGPHYNELLIGDEGAIDPVSPASTGRPGSRSTKRPATGDGRSATGRQHPATGGGARGAD